MKSINVSSKRLTIKLSTLISCILMALSVSVYFIGLDGMGTIEFLISLSIMLFGFNNYRMAKVLPIAVLTFFVLLMLVLSGKMGQTGFNAPIKHALKFVHLLFAFVCFSFFNYGANIKQKKFFVITVLLAAAISCIQSIYLVFAGNDYAIRYASRYGFSAEGVAGFSQIYGIPALVLIVSSTLFNDRKKTFWQKVLLILLLGIFFYFIGVSLFTTALLLTVLGIVFFMFLKMLRRDARTTLIIMMASIVLALMIIFVFSDQTMSLIKDLTSGMNYISRDRIQFIAGKLLLVSSDLTYSYDRRLELAGYSLQTFEDNPFFGVGYFEYGYGVIGCHQEWADLLGVFGLFGSTIVIIVLLGMFASLFRVLKTQEEKDLFFVLITMFIVLGFLNPCLGSPFLLALFVVMPNAKYLFYSETENKF